MIELDGGERFAVVTPEGKSQKEKKTQHQWCISSPVCCPSKHQGIYTPPPAPLLPWYKCCLTGPPKIHNHVICLFHVPDEIVPTPRHKEVHQFSVFSLLSISEHPTTPHHPILTELPALSRWLWVCWAGGVFSSNPPTSKLKWILKLVCRLRCSNKSRSRTFIT